MQIHDFIYIYILTEISRISICQELPELHRWIDYYSGPSLSVSWGYLTHLELLQITYYCPLACKLINNQILLFSSQKNKKIKNKTILQILQIGQLSKPRDKRSRQVGISKIPSNFNELIPWSSVYKQNWDAQERKRNLQSCYAIVTVASNMEPSAGIN